MKMLHKVWKNLIWVWNKCQGYEKSAWWYETNDKCSETNTHLKDAHIVLLTDFFRTVFVWCGFVSYHCQWQYTLCTVFKSIHIPLEPHSTFFTTNNGSKIVLCAIGCTPQMDLFCTIETFFVPESVGLCLGSRMNFYIGQCTERSSFEFRLPNNRYENRSWSSWIFLFFSWIFLFFG